MHRCTTIESHRSLKWKLHWFCHTHTRNTKYTTSERDGSDGNGGFSLFPYAIPFRLDGGLHARNKRHVAWRRSNQDPHPPIRPYPSRCYVCFRVKPPPNRKKASSKLTSTRSSLTARWATAFSGRCLGLVWCKCALTYCIWKRFLVALLGFRQTLCCGTVFLLVFEAKIVVSCIP